ncbi:P-loop NTPase fold protein [Streptococcus oralis]|uniref:P-loop NTPase fold protein n=1 Tax=Streptococcus oralis TaxID=1303 RepID=UPI002283CF36|nr:P-loop NTPase fold protein [Streptococcus oralis]MCY7102299.1 KAP family NTPase [Streptococcus oralis]
MKNIVTRILNFFLNFKQLLKYPFQRPSWSSNVRIVEWYKIFIASIWVLYLALEIEQFKRFASPIYKFVSNYNFLKDIISMLYENRVIILLALTIPIILFWFLDIIFKKVSYKKLNPELFPEYDLDDYPYQTHLVEFLNSSDSIHNVFWLDGSWGSGKTFFIKTFFENQIYKKKEIYYISCFGIKTREQAEKILINEIEKQSILGNLDFIPLVGGVFKWFFKTVGTDLMKRDSIIIFDDFERVSYAETSDNPSDYNDLLGYIDYLSENKKFKIIVILNSKEMESTKENLIDKKFKLNHNRIVSTGEVIDNILRKSKLKDDDLGKILSLIFKIYYVDIDEKVVQNKKKNRKVEKPSLREFQKSLEELSNKTDESEKADCIIKGMNGWEEIDSILVLFFECYMYFNGIDKYNKLIESDRYFHFEMLAKIVDFNIEDLIVISYDLSNVDGELYNKKKAYLSQLLSCLWKIGLRNLFLSEKTNKVFYRNYNYSSYEIEERLVEIYYDVLDKNIKDDYRINNIERLEDPEYQNFIKKYLPLESKGKITINQIPLDKLIQ